MVGAWITRRAEPDSHATRTTGKACAGGNATGTGRRADFAIADHLVASNADTDAIVTKVADIDAAPNLHSDSGSNFDTATNVNTDTDTNAAANADADAKPDGNEDAATHRNADRGCNSDAAIDINANAVTY